jgi:alpha-glucosidase
MKSIICLLLLAPFFVHAISFGEVVKSPNGRVAVKLQQGSSGSLISLSLDDMPCGVMKVGPNRSNCTAEILNSSSKTVQSSWKSVWGFKEKYPDNYEEIKIDFNQKGKQERSYSLELRVYNEGVAARWSFYSTVYGNHYFTSENTSFTFPDGSVAWPIPGGESTFPVEPYEINKLQSGKTWRVPFTLRVPNGIYASIFEAHAISFPRSIVKTHGTNMLTLEYIMGGKEYRGECVSPWRVVMLGKTPGALIEQAYLVENLNDECAIKDTSWIKPGLSVSDQSNFRFKTEEIIHAAKLAAKIGCRYIQMDWGWYGTEYPWTEENIKDYAKKHPELANDKSWIENAKANPYTCAEGYVPYHPYWNYGGRKGVSLDMKKIVSELKKLNLGLCLYIHDYVLSLHDMDKLFATYKEWGVQGLKPGFVGYGSQASTDHIRKMAELAAKHNLWLCIHDSHLPDGLERTWPNVMLTEGGGGAEGNHPTHQDVALPFTRCLAGPFDFTPVFYRKDVTKERTAAFFIVYPGASAVMRGPLANFKDYDFKLFEFVKELPWTYDDTIVPAGEISKNIIVFKRKGNKWFVGGMCAKDGVNFKIPTDFLGKGNNYKMRLWHGGKCTESNFTGGNEFNIALSSNDGFVAILEK